jgi:flagellar hook-associated protein 3 FlgL
MRVSSKTFQLQWLNSFNQRQVELADIQRQVSTGRRVATAADDPAGAAQMVQLQQGLDRIENYRANAETARRRLSLEETALDEVTNMLDRVRELAIQAGGAARNAEGREAIAAEAREMLANLMDLANSQDGEGRYLFAGSRVQNQPFTAAGGMVSYSGDDGTRFQRIGDNRTIAEADAGSEVFQQIRSGNGTFTVDPNVGNSGTAFYKTADVADPSAWIADTYTISFTAPNAFEITDSGGAVIQSGSFAAGDTLTFNGAAVTVDGQPAAGDSFTVTPSAYQDIFATVQNFIAAMESAPSSPEARALTTSNLNSTLLDLDRALSHISTVRSSVGARLAAIDAQADNNEELAIQMTQTMSLVRDVDYASAISELEQQLIGLEAAQKTFARTRSFSLFSLI